jgi:hypothetical protein
LKKPELSWSRRYKKLLKVDIAVKEIYPLSLHLHLTSREREGQVRDILAKKPVLPTDNGERTVQQHWWLDQTRSEAKMNMNVIKAYLLSQQIKIKLVDHLKN